MCRGVLVIWHTQKDPVGLPHLWASQTLSLTSAQLSSSPTPRFYPTSIDCINRNVELQAIYTTFPDCTSLLWLVLSGNLFLIYLYFALHYRNVPKLFYYKLRKTIYRLKSPFI